MLHLKFLQSWCTPSVKLLYAYNNPLHRIRHAVADGSSDSVVGVDGSYLHKKYKSLMDAGTSVNPLGPPEQPPHGWSSIPLQNVDAESVLTLIPNLPPVTAGIQ